MQYGSLFQVVFHSTDPRIKAKIATGTLYFLGSLVLTPVLVGILGFFILAGYGLRVLQNVQDDQEPPLPEWDQWRIDLRSGFFLVVAVIVWFLPIGILAGVTTGLTIAAGDAGSGDAPLIPFVVSLLVNIVSWIVAPGITIALAQRMELADAFRFRTILAWVVQNWFPCLLVSLISALVSSVLLVVAALAGTLALVIGLLVTIPCALFLATVYQYHLLGQLSQTYKGYVTVPDMIQSDMETESTEALRPPDPL